MVRAADGQEFPVRYRRKGVNKREVKRPKPAPDEPSQIDKLAEYLMDNWRDEITEGGAGDVAIAILRKFESQPTPDPPEGQE
jgi:hypothetical protein